MLFRSLSEAEIETRDLTAKEEAAIEDDPLLPNAVTDVMQGVSPQEFADVNEISLERAEVLFDEAKRQIGLEEGAISEADAEIDARHAAAPEQPAVTPTARRPKGPVTAQGREARTGRLGMGGAKPVPDFVQREINTGNPRPFLNVLRSSANNPIQRAVAQLIYN